MLRETAGTGALSSQKQDRGKSEKRISCSAQALKPGAVVGEARAVRCCHCATLIKEMGERSNAEQVRASALAQRKSKLKKKGNQI